MATVCETCGDLGFVEALVYCDSCNIATVHRYCLDITPVPIHDCVVWFCVNCVGSDSGSESGGEEVNQPANFTLIWKKSEKNNNNHGLQDTTNVEPVTGSSSPTKETCKESEGSDISGSGNPRGLTGLVTKGASVMEASNSPSVPDHDSSTNRKRILSSRNCDQEADSFKPRTPSGASNDPPNIPHTSENRQLAVVESSCIEGLTARHFNSLALDQYRAQPIVTPIWRGSISFKEGNILSIDGLVAHLSSLACHRVHDTASSLHTRISAEMIPRLEIWPKSFLKNGGPKDESIALYLFPSCGRSEFEEGEGERVLDLQQTEDEKVFDLLVLEMKKNDFAMRCMLDNAELLLFTSYMLPRHYQGFRSKEYLWGVFRAKNSCRH